MGWLTRWAKALVPARCHGWMRQARFFGFAVRCPCCGGRFRTFLSTGVMARPNARCPRCNSVERHRLLWLYLQERTDFFSAKRRVLHVAPEPFLQDRFQALPNLKYVSLDLEAPWAMLRADVTEMPCRDEAFDVILCYHVLEHVPQDRKAMGELFRVLRPGGWAILQVPLDPARETTFEDPAVCTPEARKRVFGQSDHVRIYGRDYKERLEGAGFQVRVDDYVRTLEPAVVRRYGLAVDQDIYFCVKGLGGAAEPPNPTPGRVPRPLQEDGARGDESTQERRNCVV
ncbi:MAG: class I SAM-dependent methyltransferase [Anaerolineae bacterium]